MSEKKRDISHWVRWSDAELIDQAAGASQDRILLEDKNVREAIALNVIEPFRQRIATQAAQIEALTKALNWARARLSPRDAAEFVAQFGPISLDAAIALSNTGKK